MQVDLNEVKHCKVIIGHPDACKDELPARAIGLLVYWLVLFPALIIYYYTSLNPRGWLYSLNQWPIDQSLPPSGLSGFWGGGGGARKAKISKRGVPGFKVEGPFGKNWPPMMLAASPGPQLMLVMLGSGGRVRVFQGGSKG